MMRKSLPFVIWLCICVGITNMVAFQFANQDDEVLQGNEFIINLLLNPQKMLFNYMLYYTALLYLSHKDYLSSQVVLRCKNNTFAIMRKLAIHGAKLFFIYEAMMIFSIVLAGFLLGIDMRQINVNPTLLILLPICWYCIYLTIYVLTRNHYTGMIVLVGSQLIVLLLGILLNTTVDFNFFPYVLDHRVVLPLVVSLCCVAGIVEEKREWLS